MSDLTNIQLGDLIAIPDLERYLGHGAPRVSNRLYRVNKRTPAQAEAVDIHYLSHTPIRVRLIDGKVIGQDYTYAMVATPELIEQHNQQIAIRKRWNEARLRLNDLEGKHLHQLNLSVEQLEVLADAWVRVKATGQAPVSTGNETK